MLDEAALRGLVERSLLPTLSAESSIQEISARRLDSGWYGAWMVLARLDDGSGHRLFLKDYGTFREPKDDMLGRRERERCAYERLLRPELHGTARCYGSEWDPERPRHWLLLEYVEGGPLRYEGLECWRRAAAWLARFQSSLRSGEWRACPTLRRHDEEFFLSAVERAVRAVSTWSSEWGDRVGALAEEYAPLVAPLVGGPTTLVHGAFLPIQILVRAGERERRLCPLDWELAALGSPVYDLGFLSYGFEGTRRASLLNAYAKETRRLGGEVPDDLSRQVAYVGIHRTLTALGYCMERSYGEAAILEYLGILRSQVRSVRRTEAV